MNCFFSTNCAQASDRLPCRVKKNGKHEQFLFAYNFDEISLIDQLVEIRDLLIKWNLVKFTATSNCMFPLIRPGDILHIVPKGPEDIQIGDIVVFKRNYTLFSHRVIDKGEDNGRPFVVTKPDNTTEYTDGKIFSGPVIGIVRKIERNGKIVKPANPSNGFESNLLLPAFFNWYQLKEKVRVSARFLLKRIQKISAYKITGQFFLRLKKDRINISIATPFNQNGNVRFFRKLSFKNVQQSKHKLNLLLAPQFSVCFSVNTKPVAYMSFIYNPAFCPFSGWWVSGLRIKTVYHKIGVEEKLLESACVLFNMLEVSKLLVGFSKPISELVWLFQKMGFETTPFPTPSLKKQNDGFWDSLLILEREVSK